jgi:hypothetical protein
MKPANFLSQKPSRWIALIAIFAILAPTAAPAQSRHSAPEAVRARVLKLGVGQWIRLREHSGVKLEGQITGIGPRVFQIQQREAAAPTDVYYSNVEKIRCAPSERSGDTLSKDDWAGLAVTAAIVVAIFASCGVHHNC